MTVQRELITKPCLSCMPVAILMIPWMTFEQIENSLHLIWLTYRSSLASPQPPWLELQALVARAERLVASVYTLLLLLLLHLVESYCEGR